MSATTPGPWTVETDVVKNGDIHIFAPGLHPIAMVDCREHPDDDDDPPRETALANAVVMAAAPDLLAALRDTLNYWEATGFAECEKDCDCVVEIVRAAIAKAEGR